LNSFGQQIKITIFGESHGPNIGAIIDSPPCGVKIEVDKIEERLAKRRPNAATSTSRVEKDNFKIISGLFNSVTTGGPLCIVIENKNVDDKVYDDVYGIMRPSNADYTQYEKYHGFSDYRGGGRFSGRLTAALVAAGAVAEMCLAKRDIKIGTHILKVKDIEDRKIEMMEDTYFIKSSDFPMLSKDAKEKLIKEIEKAKSEGDSIGAITETAIYNLSIGLGEPMFDTVESKLSKAIFGIPAIKGISFGMGFDFANYNGSSVNDIPYVQDDNILYKSNNNGGINGGITNGAPIIFNTVVKPTPSIYKEQESVNYMKKENTKIKIEGRHDPFIAHRACPVIDAVSYLVVLDLFAIRYGNDFISNK
jgi:chorismate synthase